MGAVGAAFSAALLARTGFAGAAFALTGFAGAAFSAALLAPTGFAGAAFALTGLGADLVGFTVTFDVAMGFAFVGGRTALLGAAAL
jgi:hypothetical protein